VPYESVVLSFEVAVFATLLAGVVGLAAAALLANSDFRGKNLLDVFFTAPLVLPPTVLGYFLLSTLGRKSILGSLYESIVGSPIVFTKAGAVAAAALGSLPLIVRTGRAALESVGADYMDAARTLGASKVRALLTVQVPLARRGLVAACMLGFAKSLGEFGITLMVAGNFPGRTQTASLAIMDAILGQREHDAAVLALVMTVLGSSCLYIVVRASDLPARRRG
jgi:molybdate transport system permease protein